MARRRLEGLERVLGVNALFSTAYGNVGSSIYYALGLVASYALGLTPLVFIITGSDSEQAMEEVMESLPSYSIHSVLVDALEAGDREAKTTSIRRLAVLGAATETDPNILAIFDAAFLDPDPEVRRLAAGATTYPAWPEFEPRLELLAEKDQDESVRERAKRALAALREHQWS